VTDLEGDLGALIVLADAVRELTSPRTNAARFVRQDDRGRAVEHAVHYTPHPSLLDQLRAAGTAGRGGDATMSGGYESRPAARLEAIDVLEGIEREVDDWLVRRFATDVRPTLEGNLHAVVGLAASADDDLQARLARDVVSWQTRARVVTGWDSAPWRPNAACPACENVGTLRVRLEERCAACLHCKETWTPATIGILADHLREINADSRTRKQQRAQLEAELDGFFAFRGPCLSCIHPSPAGLDKVEAAALSRRVDGRHRQLDAVVERVLYGERPGDVADALALPVEAVLVAVAVATWPADDAEHQAQSA